MSEESVLCMVPSKLQCSHFTREFTSFGSLICDAARSFHLLGVKHAMYIHFWTRNWRKYNQIYVSHTQECLQPKKLRPFILGRAYHLLITVHVVLKTQLSFCSILLPTPLWTKEHVRNGAALQLWFQILKNAVFSWLEYDSTRSGLVTKRSMIWQGNPLREREAMNYLEGWVRGAFTNKFAILYA